jgi:hypothetical protein
MPDQNNAHEIVQAIIDGSQTAYLLDGSVATLIVEALESRTSDDAAALAAMAGTAGFISDKAALADVLGKHQGQIQRVEPLTPGMGTKDTGGLVCSCGEWSASVLESGIRPWNLFLGHHADAILALGFDRKAQAAAAAGWADGVETALNHAIRNPDRITLRLEHLDGRPWLNPFEPVPAEGARHA